MSGDSYGSIDAHTIEQCIEAYLMSGGSVFETSSSYGLNREAELTLASFLKNNCQFIEAKPTVITKIGNLPHTGQIMPQQWDEQFLTEQIEIAQDIFGDFLEGILLHSPPLDGDIVGSLGILSSKLRTKGKKIGIAIRTVTDLKNKNLFEALMKCAPDIITVNYSLMDQRLDEIDQLNELQKKSIEIWARTVFNFGFLANPDLKIQPSLDHRNTWSDAQILRWREGGRLFSDLASKYGSSLSSFAIGFALRNKLIDRVCLGMNSSTEVTSNMESALQAIPDGAIKKAKELYFQNEFFVKK